MIDRLKRRSDYTLVLDALAGNCPDVAMLFLEFEIGPVEGRAVRQRPDPAMILLPDDWPPWTDVDF